MDKAVAVMGYPDRLNKYRLVTNRISSVELKNKTQDKQKQ